MVTNILTYTLVICFMVDIDYAYFYLKVSKALLPKPATKLLLMLLVILNLLPKLYFLLKRLWGVRECSAILVQYKLENTTKCGHPCAKTGSTSIFRNITIP